jgi:1-acyl-sn-glycerol-3-phosphate acyltransferase
MSNTEKGAQPAGIQEPTADAETRRQLIAELDALIQRTQALVPGYKPPPFSPRRLLSFLQERLRDLPLDLQLPILEQLRKSFDQDLLDVEVWKGVWYMANYTLQYNADVVKRRFSGEYDTDPWGMDWEFLDVMRPFFAFLYKVYWRVQTAGIDNIPVEGRTMLVANRSGPLPWDGLMIATAVMTEHPAQRVVRTLHDEWLSTVPFVSSWFVRMGQAVAAGDNGARLLEHDELVAVFPEGDRGAAKVYKDRYKLARFGEGEFVQTALKTGSPIVPISVVGAEETYISLGQSRTVARLAGLPYFPVTQAFPWLGILGLVPLPTKWYLDFGEPLSLNEYGPDAALDLMLVSQLADRVRRTIQEMLHSRLARRRSPFF